MFEAHAAAFTADVETSFQPFIATLDRSFPPHDDVRSPEAGWAARNPDRAMLFLFVSPRDCGAVDELLAA
jgi:hypothetical protein